MSPLLLIALLSNTVLCADIVEGMVRNVLLSIRGVGEKVLSNIAIPTSEDLVNTPVIGFQVDDKSAYALKSFGEFLNTCPPALPPPSLTGTWTVAYASKKWLQTTMIDLDDVINLLANNQNVPRTRPLSSIFRAELPVSCLKLRFPDQNSDVRSPFEISYTKNGQNFSLIGEVARLPDKSLDIAFIPSLSKHMVVAYTSTSANESPLDVMALSETETFPKCENYLVLQRSQQSTGIFRILSAMGANVPSNPLQEIPCEQNGNGKLLNRPS